MADEKKKKTRQKQKRTGEPNGHDSEKAHAVYEHMKQELEAENKKEHRPEKAKGANFLDHALFPVFVSVVFIAVIAIGIWAIFSMTSPQTLSFSDFSHSNIVQEKPMAKMLLLYSDDCAGCEQTNSFIRLLEANDIPYYREKIEINSEDGKKIVDAIRPAKIPLVILDGKSLDASMKVKTKGGVFSLKSVIEDEYVKSEQVFKWNDAYVIPEINLDQSGHVEMYLDENSCGSKEKIQVALVTDPYCAPCALSTVSFSDTAKLFAGNIAAVDYNFYPLDSRKMLYKWEQISPFANYSICANRQGKLDEFQSVVYKYYCAPDKTALDFNALQNCAASPNFHMPIPAQKLTDAVGLVGIDKQELGLCLEQIEKEKPLMVSSANALGISAVPTVVLNCKYVTHAENLKAGICSINPSLQACRAS